MRTLLLMFPSSSPLESSSNTLKLTARSKLVLEPACSSESRQLAVRRICSDSWAGWSSGKAQASLAGPNPTSAPAGTVQVALVDGRACWRQGESVARRWEDETCTMGGEGQLQQCMWHLFPFARLCAPFTPPWRTGLYCDKLSHRKESWIGTVLECCQRLSKGFTTNY